MAKENIPSIGGERSRENNDTSYVLRTNVEVIYFFEVNRAI